MVECIRSRTKEVGVASPKSTSAEAEVKYERLRTDQAVSQRTPVLGGQIDHHESVLDDKPTWAVRGARILVRARAKESRTMTHLTRTCDDFTR